MRKNNDWDISFNLAIEELTFKNVLKLVIKRLLSFVVWFFIPLFSFFDLLATKRKLVISSVGLGIGLGLSVLVTQHPDILQAFPQLNIQDTTGVHVARLHISNIDLSVPVIHTSVQDVVNNTTSNALVHDERSGKLGGKSPVVIAQVGLDPILRELESVAIGDTIIVEGSNGAQYHFIVTQIRDMQAEYLPSVVGAHESALIIYKPKNVLRTRLYMVIAQVKK